MKTALFTVSFNRPDLMQQLLDGLKENIEDLSGIDVYHYIDGGPKSDQPAIQKIIQDSEVPCTSVILREENYGVGRNLIGARRDLFDVHGYERVILIEDDLIPGPNFIKTTLSLADWAKSYNDVGMVQVWNLPHREITEADLDIVEPTHEHFYSYCIDVEVWNEIKETIYAYESQYLLGVSYANKVWRAIRKKFMKPRYSNVRLMREPIATASTQSMGELHRVLEVARIGGDLNISHGLCDQILYRRTSTFVGIRSDIVLAPIHLWHVIARTDAHGRVCRSHDPWGSVWMTCPIRVCTRMYV